MIIKKRNKKKSGCLRMKCNYVLVNRLRDHNSAPCFFHRRRQLLDSSSFCKSCHSDLLFPLIFCERELHAKIHIPIWKSNSHLRTNHVQIIHHYTVYNQSNRVFQVDKISLTQCEYLCVVVRGTWSLLMPTIPIMQLA